MEFGFEFEDGLFDQSDAIGLSTARADRILAGRKAASSYAAKIEDPGWFNAPDHSTARKATRSPELHAIQNLYLLQAYAAVIARTLVLLKEVKPGGGSSDETELVDMICRAALKVDGEVTPEVLDVAGRYEAHVKSCPGLSFSAAQLFHKASRPLNAIEACLSAIAMRGSLTPYTTFLTLLFVATSLPTSPLSPLTVESHAFIASLLTDYSLRKAASTPVVQRVVDSLGLNEVRATALMKLLVFSTEEDEVEELPRDVRNL